MIVQFTPSARVQFLNAIEAIRRHNLSAAQKFRRQAGIALKRLARFPKSGSLVEDFPELPYREVYVKPYRFFYRVQAETLWIVAVWHAAQVPEDPWSP